LRAAVGTSLNGVQSITFRQPHSTSGYIGDEWEDGVEYYGNTNAGSGTYINCVYAEGCRQSDAALVQLHLTRTPGVGRIARTTNNAGSRVVSSSNSFIPIGWVRGNRLPVMSFVNKIGQRSGWTVGEVYDQCYDMANWESGYGFTVNIECTTIATYVSLSGDSGAPVFQLNPYDGNSLAGMHIGSVTGFGGEIYSVFTGIVNLGLDWRIAYLNSGKDPKDQIEWRYGY
jgi:hypothetical protein